MLHDGEMYTAFDFSRTISDSYNFEFQLTDEYDSPLENQIVWMEIGFKPKAGTNFKHLT